MLHRLMPVIYLLGISFAGSVNAQPYFDVASFQYWNASPDLSQDSAGESFFSLGVSAPVKVGSGKSLLLSPQYDSRILSGFDVNPSNQLRSASMPISFLWYDTDSSWMMNFTAINRINNNGSFRLDDSWQIGGAFVFSRQFKNRLWVRAGAYYSREFFGDYFLPLLGCDWRISDRWRLFGLLPSNMRLQYTVASNTNLGISFRSFTNSYRKPVSGYVKLYDNHLFIFADTRIYRHMVGVMEVGYSEFRKVWDRDPSQHYLVESSGFLIKCGLFYRIPLP